jgi:hypothetical protein
MVMNAFAEAGLGRAVGLRVGELLGKTLVLNACLPDHEDDLERRPFRRRIQRLPPGVDLRRWMTPVEDQGEIGSCTSNALASLVEYLIFRQTGRVVDVSRLFLYYNQRLWRGSVREDSGSALATGVRVLSQLGVPAEGIWPYEPRLFAVQPPRVVYQIASHHRALDYASVPCDADAVRACLAEGFPVAFGTMVFSSFKATGRDGRTPMPRAGEPEEGGHAMALVGYSDAERVFIVRNSWGAGWGDQGYAYVPYDYILDPGLSHAMWAIRLSESVDFSADEHAEVNLASMPSAPPPRAATGPVNPFAASTSGGGMFGVVGSLLGAGGSTPIELAGSLAERFSGTALTVLTGSAAVGSLLGGVVAGVAPSLVSRVEHGDAGAVAGEDLSPRVLAILRGEAPEAAVAADPHAHEAVAPERPRAAEPVTGNYESTRSRTEIARSEGPSRRSRTPTAAGRGSRAEEARSSRTRRSVPSCSRVRSTSCGTASARSRARSDTLSAIPSPRETRTRRRPAGSSTA